MGLDRKRDETMTPVPHRLHEGNSYILLGSCIYFFGTHKRKVRKRAKTVVNNNSC